MDATYQDLEGKIIDDPRNRIPSHYTLEYYEFAPQGFAPAGVWDESVLELSRNYWIEKFNKTYFYLSWAYFDNHKEKNPEGVVYRYPQDADAGEKPKGEKSLLSFYNSLY